MKRVGERKEKVVRPISRTTTLRDDEAGGKTCTARSVTPQGWYAGYSVSVSFISRIKTLRDDGVGATLRDDRWFVKPLIFL